MIRRINYGTISLALWMVLRIAVSAGFNIETRDVESVPLPGYRKDSWLGQSIIAEYDS